MTSARKSNIKYSVFICISVLLLGIIFAFSSTKQRTNSSEDYDRSLDIGGYVVKISGCVYFTDTNEIVFTFKYKPVVEMPSNSIPEIYNVTYSTEDTVNTKLSYNTQDKAVGEQTVTCTDFDTKKICYIKVDFISKEPDYYDEDTYDEFGDIIKGEFHEGKKYDSYVKIDVQDMLRMTKNDYKTYTTQAPVTAADESSVTDKVIDPQGTFVVTTTVPITSSTATSSTTVSVSTEKETETSSEKEVKVTAKSDDTNAEQQTQEQYVYNTQPQYYDDNNNNTEPPQTERQTQRQTQQYTTTTVTTAYTPPEIKGLRLESSYSNNDVKLSIGENTTLTAVISPSNAMGSIVWESNRTDIAEVDSSGRVTAKAKGKAIITARSASNSSVTASCMITVE
ncbi:Ig-like domain-containing protein [Ruminococcus sp.]|uniref:Ig-like domain-containing protein n=1 Tax=Ruminococcus sp. TaxID=41978 RepID=UPI00396797D7